MKIGIIADIHSNLEAFTKVSELLKVSKVDKIWCLGDVVGYGPKPNECIELLLSMNAHTVVGNHDLGSIEKLSLAEFSYDAGEACSWTSRELTMENKAYLGKLPSKSEPAASVTLIHGSPRDPIWEYITSSGIAMANFKHFDGNLAFVGHVHVPFIFEKTLDIIKLIKLKENVEIKLKEESKYIINPGSVGQPRDGNPQASYMIFDIENCLIEYKRASYDIALTQKAMREAGLPLFLIERLPYGI